MCGKHAEAHEESSVSLIFKSMSPLFQGVWRKGASVALVAELK